MLETSAQLQERVSAQLLAQLTDDEGLVIDDVKVERALEHAWAVIEGYLFTLPEGAQPQEDTLVAHQVTLALVTLAGNRQGEELKAIRAAANDSLQYLRSLRPNKMEASPDLSHSAPDPLFSDCDLADFGKFGGAL